MNLFRLCGDVIHLVSFFVILRKIYGSKADSCRGVSLKTQELYAVVFVCRYLDLFYNFISLYNTLFKVLYISLTVGAIMGVRLLGTATGYEPQYDRFGHLLLCVPCAALAYLCNAYPSSWIEFLWTFSILLEPVAALPQLVMLQQRQDAGLGLDGSVLTYLGMLCAYRFFYILNWVYRFLTEFWYRQDLVWACGVAHVLIYVPFFLRYYRKSRSGTAAAGQGAGSAAGSVTVPLLDPNSSVPVPLAGERHAAWSETVGLSTAGAGAGGVGKQQQQQVWVREQELLQELRQSLPAVWLLPVRSGPRGPPPLQPLPCPPLGNP